MIPLRDNMPISRTPWVTYGLIFVNSIIFLYEQSLPDPRLEALLDRFALVPDRLGLDGGSFLALFSNQFLHGGWLHLIGNMWMLYLFGDNVEDRVGPGPFLFLYLVSGVSANLTQWAIFPESGVPVIGASGAIAGVMGAYLLLFPHARVLTLIPIFILIYFVEFPAWLFLGWWLLIQALNGLMTVGTKVDFEGVAWWAHLGGFAAGMLLVTALAPPTPSPRRFLARDIYEDEPDDL